MGRGRGGKRGYNAIPPFCFENYQHHLQNILWVTDISLFSAASSMIYSIERLSIFIVWIRVPRIPRGGGGSRDIRWDKSYYRGQVAASTWQSAPMPKLVAAYEHGNHIRLKPHCLMDAICLNPIIRPQFITATLFSYRCDTVCFNNSSSISCPLLRVCNRKWSSGEGGNILQSHVHPSNPCNDREIFSQNIIINIERGMFSFIINRTRRNFMILYDK